VFEVSVSAIISVDKEVLCINTGAIKLSYSYRENRMVKVCLKGLNICSIALVMSAFSPLVTFADPAQPPAASPQTPVLGNATTAEAPKPPAPLAQTIADPAVDIDDLKLLIEPLTKAELEVEANGWFGLVRSKVKEISEAELAVRRKNREIATLKEVKKAAKEAASVEAKTNPSKTDGAQSDEQKKAQANLTAANAKLSESAKAAEAKADVKVQLVDYSTKLAAERTALIDRFKVVLDQLDKLGGDSKGMRAYITAVSGLKVEVTDYESTIARLKAWLTSDEGGLRWARNLALFVAYLIGAYILSKFARGIVSRSIGKSKATSKLLQNFVVDMSGRAVMAVGLLAGLSALEIDLAPLLAVIGAAGFVVAFALQGTLSNLASGLLIMVNKPFDINDEVEVGGDIKGRVEDVTIFSTLIRTEENTRKIVPNNTIWGGVIVNRSTGAVTPAHAS
jgi:small conductance mechanosensitive channel